MASSSSSSSSSPRTWRYSVFASFHGPDVRKTFLSHLRKQFSSNGISMFDDQGIERSRTIAPALTQAIRESRISIVVLSKNYASSSWCLDELLEILKCKEAMGQIVMTVFHGVDPSHVRKQRGDFGSIFNETCALKTEEERRRWSQALVEAGNIAGEDLQNWDNEADMIEKIAKEVSDKLNATPSRDFDGMVGLEDHLREMECLLDLDNEGVKMVGIFGPAGIGKTTIARALRSLLIDKFPLTCFVDNLRESYHSSSFDEYGSKLRLQEQFLSKVLNENDMRVCHLGVIQERLRDQKVLVILDDVNNIKQLEALANETTWFGPGSRIVVTTENKELLKQHGINVTYHVGFPSDEEAVKILRRYAFRQQNSLYHGFEKLALRVARLCGNLPLGLCVVGSSLRGKKEDEWEDVMSRLETILDRGIEDVLRVGYESLDEDEQTLFLHIAVFFNYKNGDFVKTMFADSDLDVKRGLKILVNRSLIEIYTYGEIIVMHRLLQQVGKIAIRKQEPWKRKILTDAPEICHVLEHAKGTSDVSGISFDTSGVIEVCISERAFKRMRNLRFLKVYKSRDDGNNSVHIPDGEMEFPRFLRLLHWEAYPSKSLPPRFHTEYLVELEMKCSKLERLWDGIQPLTNLKKMDLSWSLHLKELPDLSNATNLETLLLSNFKSLVKLPSSFSNLHKLTTLWTNYCLKLEVIPRNLSTSLDSVDITGCSRLPDFPCASMNIITLYLADTAVKEMPTSVTLWSRLRHLDIRGNGNLKTLPKLPTNITWIDMSNNVFETISNCCFEDLDILRELTLSGCRKLASLPELPPSLEFLEANDCESLETVLFPYGFPKAELNFANCFKLGQQARRAIIQHSFSLGLALLPGSQVPKEFHHRAMGNTLTFLLSAFSSFKVCLVISPNQLTGEHDFPKVVCRRIRKGYLYPVEEIFCGVSTCRTKHLFTFHSEWLYEYRWLDVNREITFEFSSKHHDFDITRCGAQILTYETDGRNNDEEEASDEEDDEEGYISESREAYKDEDEGIADGDYESVSRKRPRKTYEDGEFLQI